MQALIVSRLTPRAHQLRASRLLSAIACELGLDLFHFDVEQAFVQSELSEDVYMRLPKGCGSMSGKVVDSCRSLYGLERGLRQ